MAQIGRHARESPASTACSRFVRLRPAFGRRGSSAIPAPKLYDDLDSLAAARSGADAHAAGVTALDQRVRAAWRLDRLVDALRAAKSPEGECGLMLLLIANYLTEFISGFNVFTYITMRAIMSALTALVISPGHGAVDDPAPERAPDRPDGADRRAGDAPAEGGHADDGRRADPRRDPGEHVAVGRPDERVRLDRRRRDAGVRPDRFRRRLQETDPEGPAGLSARWQDLLAVAVGDRRRRRTVLAGGPTVRDRAADSVPEGHRDAAGRSSISA